MMMVQYLVDADEPAVVPGVAAPQVEFGDVVSPVALALAQEKRVTEQINGLAALARQEGDYSSEQFMQWFIKEQIEEVATMSDLLRVVERSQDRPMDIEDYLAREQLGEEGDDPTAPHPPARAGPGRATHGRARGARSTLAIWASTSTPGRGARDVPSRAAPRSTARRRPSRIGFGRSAQGGDRRAGAGERAGRPARPRGRSRRAAPRPGRRPRRGRPRRARRRAAPACRPPPARGRAPRPRPRPRPPRAAPRPPRPAPRHRRLAPRVVRRPALRLEHGGPAVRVRLGERQRALAQRVGPRGVVVAPRVPRGHRRQRRAQRAAPRRARPAAGRGGSRSERGKVDRSVSAPHAGVSKGGRFAHCPSPPRVDTNRTTAAALREPRRRPEEERTTAWSERSSRRRRSPRAPRR